LLGSVKALLLFCCSSVARHPKRVWFRDHLDQFMPIQTRLNSFKLIQTQDHYVIPKPVGSGTVGLSAGRCGQNFRLTPQ
jgi:hypothetical protein